MLGKRAILSSGKSRKADDPVKRIVSYSPTFMAIRRMGYPFQQLPQWLQMKWPNVNNAGGIVPNGSMRRRVRRNQRRRKWNCSQWCSSFLMALCQGGKKNSWFGFLNTSESCQDWRSVIPSLFGGNHRKLGFHVQFPTHELQGSVKKCQLIQLNKCYPSMHTFNVPF